MQGAKKVTNKGTGNVGIMVLTPKMGGGMVTMAGKTYWISAAQAAKWLKIG